MSLRALAKTKSQLTKNLNHEPRDVIDYHMGTQFVKLNEAICWISKVKKIFKMFENRVKWTINR